MQQERRRWALAALLALVSFMNYTDRMILPAVSQAIKLEFELSDTALGLLNGFVFVALYAFASLPLARLADRTSRSLVLAGALAFWSLATAACGLVRSFGQLVVARACVGIGEAAAQPVGYALVSEQFEPRRRNAAMAWFILGNNLGIMAGFALGGWIGARYGWRTAFLALGLPGLLLAVALAQFRAPPAAAAAGPPAAAPSDAAQRPSFLATVAQLMRNRRYRLLVLLSGVFGMTVFGPVAFLPAFFVRSHGLPMGVVGAWSGIAIGLGMASGVMAGGALADRMTPSGAERPQWLCAVAMLLSALAFVAALTLDDHRWAFAATFLATALGSIGSPVIATAIQNESPPQVRAVAASLGTLCVSFLGIGLAPLLIGVLSDAFAATRAQESLRYALLWSLLLCVLTAALHLRLGGLLRAPRTEVRAG